MVQKLAKKQKSSISMSLEITKNRKIKLLPNNSSTEQHERNNQYD